MKWTGQRSPEKILKPGDIVYVKVIALGADGSAKVSLEQDSGAQGALLAIDNATGDIKAMVGGRDYDESKFTREFRNHAAGELRMRVQSGADRRAPKRDLSQ